MRSLRTFALPTLLLGSAVLANAQDQAGGVEPSGAGNVSSETIMPAGPPTAAAAANPVAAAVDVKASGDSSNHALGNTASLDAAPRVWPAYLGAYDPEDEDEREIWQQMEELERKLSTQKDILRDEQLDAYLMDVMCNTVGPERCGGVRIYVLRNASFNAGMYPNGMMVVHTGALLRLRSEAELAFLLGHEFAHYEGRHGLQSFRKARSASDIFTFAAMAGAAGSIVGMLLVSDIFTFSRDQEQQADIKSTEFLGASGYSQRAAAEVWLRMIDEDDARSEERNRSKSGRTTGWLDSHPAPFVRAAYLDRARSVADGEGIEDRDRYVGKLMPFITRFYDDQLQRNDFAASEYILNEMAAGTWSADLLQLRGELYRTRGEQGDLQAAAGYFLEAIALGNARPETWRGLGLAKIRLGEREDGQAALRKYLELKPDAPDAGMIQMMSGGF